MKDISTTAHNEEVAQQVFSLACDLIKQPSITPNDLNCQKIIAERLSKIGFACQHLSFGDDAEKVENLWAIRQGTDPDASVLVLAGHTDVVPTGPLDQWTSPPFEPTMRDGKLFGRGTADMKSSLSAFVIAAEQFVAANPQHKGHIALLLTSDEEGPSVNGTVKICEWLSQQGQRLDYCIVGEPTSVKQLGDVIKNGRRGSLSGKLIIKGKQGHIAYPHLAENPVHKMAAALAELVDTVWDQGNDFFPPTTWQVSNFNSGTGATNVIPGQAIMDFNFRYGTASTVDSLKSRFTEVLHRHEIEFDLQWTNGAEPFLTPKGELVDALTKAIVKITGHIPTLSTTGGTSDGRFIAKICPQVIEFGPVNTSIHQINEHIDYKDLCQLPHIYQLVMETLIC